MRPSLQRGWFDAVFKRILDVLFLLSHVVFVVVVTIVDAVEKLCRKHHRSR